MLAPIITKKQANLIANSPDGDIELSLDLGMTKKKISVKQGFAVIEGQRIPLRDFEKLDRNACYLAENSQLKRMAFFEGNFFYKLVPTKDWPTFTLSSTPMHRHTGMSPKEDTLLKIKMISPVAGNVLDTCCGLGYTAITASQDADAVFTFEPDENVIRIAELNPYSQKLFSGGKIRLFRKDVFEGIGKLKPDYFDRIIHDPPTYKYSPLLYSKEFYSELFRVLKKDGILYHYSPMPQKTKGKTFYEALIKKLDAAGFKDVKYDPASSGVVARK